MLTSSPDYLISVEKMHPLSVNQNFPLPLQEPISFTRDIFEFCSPKREKSKVWAL